jgi:hypothetical protein
MNRYWSLFVLVCLMVVPCWAEDNHNAGLGFSKPGLVKSSFAAGRTAIEMYADSRVDVASLLSDLDLSRPASAQAISDHVNAKRKQLYPDEEIVLSIAPPQEPRAGSSGPEEKTALVRAIYWWNNANCSTCYWYALYTSTVATMVIDDVQSGAYNVYDVVGTGSWVFRYLVKKGGAATRYSFGPNALRGFKGASVGVASKADVVMYFFN